MHTLTIFVVHGKMAHYPGGGVTLTKRTGVLVENFERTS